MPENRTDDDKEISPGSDQGPGSRPTASHNTPPNSPSETDDITMSSRDDGNGPSRTDSDS